MAGDDRAWLVLFHQLPAKPDYLRVKIGRRLQALGALPLKNAVYLLPTSDQALEDFQWVVREIVAARGEATLVEARFVDRASDESARALFQSTRETDYRDLLAEVRRLRSTKRRRRERSAGAPAELSSLARLKKRLAEIAAVDFFGASGRQAAEAAIEEWEAIVRNAPIRRSGPAASKPRNRTWVTREGIKVDRMASAWLIRRFLDEKAKFKFVPAKGYKPRPSELRFDMFDAEFTHVGDRCTFEVLIERFALGGGALTALAEVVHDIDLKDEKFGRPEAAGIDQAVRGLTLVCESDEDRLSHGMALFEGLYQTFAAKADDRAQRKTTRRKR